MDDLLIVFLPFILVATIPYIIMGLVNYKLAQKAGLGHEAWKA